jgi:hypothetical protein
MTGNKAGGAKQERNLLFIIHSLVVPNWNPFGVSVITHTNTHGRTPLDE